MMYFFYKIGWPRLDAVKVAHSDALHPQDPPMCSVLTALKIFLWKRLEPENYPNDYNLGFFRLPGSPQKIETNLYLNIHMKPKQPMNQAFKYWNFPRRCGRFTQDICGTTSWRPLVIAIQVARRKRVRASCGRGLSFFWACNQKAHGKWWKISIMWASFCEIWGFVWIFQGCVGLPEIAGGQW